MARIAELKDNYFPSVPACAPGHRQYSTAQKNYEDLDLPSYGGDCTASASHGIEMSLPAASTYFLPDGSVLTYPDGHGGIKSIQGLSMAMIEARCPLLAFAVEETGLGPRLFLDLLTTISADPFVRFLETGSYASVDRLEADIYEDVPTSVLLHCQMLRLGAVYDLPKLKTQAYVNLLRQCEFACSSPEKPIDLCEAIRYVYEHLAQPANPDAKGVLVSYCVSQFLRHKLQGDEAFCKLASEVQPFYKDLVDGCLDWQFEDDPAAAIIAMPFERRPPEIYASREDVHTKNFSDFARYSHNLAVSHPAISRHKRNEDSASNKTFGDGVMPLRLKPTRLRDKVKQRRMSRLALRQKDARGKLVEEGSCQAGADLITADGAYHTQQRSVYPDDVVVENVLSSDGEYEILSASTERAALDSDSGSEGSLVVVSEPSDCESDAAGSMSTLRLDASLSNTTTTVVTERADACSDSEWESL